MPEHPPNEPETCVVCGNAIRDHHDVEQDAHEGCFEAAMERDRPPHRGLQLQRRGQL